MRTFRTLAAAIAAISALTAFNTPAFAISQQQWTNLCVNFHGLRSGANQADTNGAGYGMDNGVAPMACLGPPPNWDALLDTTLTPIKNFPNSGPRYLLIVSGCPGLAADYPGAFPKCNNVTGNVVVFTPQTLANYTVPQLVNWVNANL